MDNEQLITKLNGMRQDISGMLEQMLMVEREVEALTREVNLIKEHIRSINDKLSMTAKIILPKG